MKTRNILFLVISFLAISQYAVAADPVITSFAASSAPVSRMGGFSIVVSNHGTKADPKLLIWADFEGSVNPSSLGQRTSWDGNQGMVYVTSHSAQSPDGTGGLAKGAWNGCTGLGGLALGFTIDKGSPYFTKLTISYDQYDTYAIESDWNYKNVPRIDPAGAGGNDFVCSELALDSPACLNEAKTGNVNYGTGLVQFHNHQNQWWSHGTVQGGDTSDGVFLREINARVAMNDSDYNNGAADLTRLFLENFASDGATCPSDSDYMLLDNVAIDDTWSSVWITTTATWAASTYKYRQVTTAWDTGISGLFSVPSTEIGKTLYGYVMNSSREVNASGAVVGSGVGQTSLSPFISGVTSSSMTIRWTTVGAANYQFVIGDNSNFASPISSGIMSGGTTTHLSLDAGTTYYGQVKISTESDSSYQSVSTYTYRTGLAPFKDTEFSSHDDLLMRWATMEGSFTAALVGVSTDTLGGSLGGNGTNYFNLQPSTAYTWKIKVSSMGDSDYNSITVMTDAAPAGGGASPSNQKKGNRSRRSGRSR